MKIVKGKTALAKIFTDQVEDKAMAQIKLLSDQPWVKKANIRIMPDVHAGAGCTIGTTMLIEDKIVPNLVGVDIGCGMEVVNLGKININLPNLDQFIIENIPSGFSIREIPHRIFGSAAEEEINKIRSKEILEKAGGVECILRSIGTLGGGNHFIELDRASNGDIYVVIHSGSRNFGLQVANYYQSIADERQPYADKGLAFLTGQTAKDYLYDMQIAQKIADFNRKAMMSDIVHYLSIDIKESFTTIHNYIEQMANKNILRKGAVSAKLGEKFIIPINMRDGSLICEGKGNLDWNESAPHGAGRLMSRMTANRKLSIDDFEKQMAGIYSSSVDKSTLDESPMAYKDVKNIIDNITPTADILEIIKPIYNFKDAKRVK